MLRAMTLALAAATMIGSSAVQAQSIDLGPGGPSIDLRNQHQRERDFEREDMRRDRERERRRAEREGDYGRGGRCREITVRERDDDGRMVTRRTRECR